MTDAQSNSKAGIMDWGIGGLSVYLTCPETAVSIVYVSDSGFTPYGKTTRSELRARLNKIAEFYHSVGVTDVRVACNAASSALNHEVEKFSGVNFHSILPAGESAVKASRAKSIGVIGGQLTISSGMYQRRFESLDGTFAFAAAQPLSALVEKGELSGETVEREVQDVLNQLGPVDAILLACTHYPALSRVFRKLAPQVELLDPAIHTWSSGKSPKSHPPVEVLTTGDPGELAKAAKLAWNLELPHVQHIEI